LYNIINSKYPWINVIFLFDKHNSDLYITKMAQSMQFDCSNKKSAGYIYIYPALLLFVIYAIYITSEKPVHDQWIIV
jgi:hypothetical protein